ncbi:MAG: DUF1461 domain-containing protein, partial [Raoultibacter sp.]
MSSPSHQQTNKSQKSAGILASIITVLTVLCLMVSFIGAGLAACAVPDATTRVLSETFSQWEGSPFSQEDMVEAAVITKDYTVGSHDRDAVMAMLYTINANAEAAGTDTLRGAPTLPEAGANAATDELAAAFENASDVYVLTDDALSHLDDVFVVISGAKYALIALAIGAALGLVYLGMRVGKRRVGKVLITSGSAVLCIFAVLALWVVVDFNGFFAAFHSLFFASGTWTFSAQSLLISMYPPEC